MKGTRGTSLLASSAALTGVRRRWVTLAASPLERNSVYSPVKNCSANSVNKTALFLLTISARLQANLTVTPTNGRPFGYQPRRPPLSLNRLGDLEARGAACLGLPECATPPQEVYDLAKRRGMDS